MPSPPDITITLTPHEASWLQAMLIGCETHSNVHIDILIKVVQARARAAGPEHEQAFLAGLRGIEGTA